MHSRLISIEWTGLEHKINWSKWSDTVKIIDKQLKFNWICCNNLQLVTCKWYVFENDIYRTFWIWGLRVY